MIANHPEREQIRLENVLSALGNPLATGDHSYAGRRQRAELQRPAPGGGGQVHHDHHWRVLRDSGVIWQRPQGRENMISLRREDLDARFPGLLDTLLKVMVQAG
ncbi:transcriptional regulator [Klebsiella pneumoniae]|uniref:Transcriptional regulator n=1 Tax=Klebsiella pneumoniae TaxID=573 RepID=A0A4P0YAJ8_KLEPN|nr:transcriptional regulator [Klebsiella pneumoniae]